MNVFMLMLKRFFPVMFLALFALTACGGGGGGGGSSASADDMTDMPDDMTPDVPEPPDVPPPPPSATDATTEYTQTADLDMSDEKPLICAVWVAGENLKFMPYSERDAGGLFTEVTFYKEQRDEFCGDQNGPDGNPIGTDGGSDDTLPDGIYSVEKTDYPVVYYYLCHGVAVNGGTAGMAHNKLYLVNFRVGSSYVGVTRGQIETICGGEVPNIPSSDSTYFFDYLNIGEMRAVNLSSDVTRTQPQLETLRISSISLSHLFQHGAMQDNMIQTHDEFGNAISFSPLQAQSIKATYGLSDAMHDLTFTAKEDEVFSNEQANLAFTTNKYDSGQSNLNAQYRFGNMFISGDYNPLIKQTKESAMQFMQISDSARDVGTLGVSHKLGNRITFTQKAGAGTLNTGNRFDEIATALAYNQDGKRLAVTMGRLREYDQFLGSVTTGAYALDEATASTFTSLHASLPLGKNLTMQANYSAMNSNVSMHHDDFVRVNGLRSDSYDVKLQSQMKSGNLSLQYLVPLAVTDGTWQQRNVINLQDSITRQDLSVNDRHEQWNLHYQSDASIFATLTRDENYSNIAGLNETRVMAGVSKRF